VEFLNELYKDLLKDGQGLMVVYLEKERLCGFVLGCFNTRDMFKLIKKNMFKYIIMIVRALYKKPWLVVKIFETLFYVKRGSCPIAAELVVMVVEASF
jgi:hypothetical protein